MIEMLSDYNPYDYDSLDRLRRPNFLKWNGAIDMWQSGLPSVDVLLIDTDNQPEIIKSLEKFIDRNKGIGCGNACVRFDHPTLPPNRDGISGIIRTDFKRITDIILNAINEGWTPSVWIYGTNRDTAPTICSMSFINDGLVIDFLPSGFEMQELSKGLVVPSAVIKTKSFSPPLRELIENPFPYLDFWFEDAGMAQQKRKTRLEACAKYRNISIAEQEMIYRNQNPLFFDNYLDTSPNKIIELIKIASDFSDFYKSRGFKLENTAIGLDLLPNGHWLLENLWNVKKYG